MGKWKTQRTLLIVGEGYDELAFLYHVKSLFSERESGQRIILKNARGKGAQHVIDWTIRQVGNFAYDTVAALLDTDTTCWTTALIKKAKYNKIQILPSEPCLEAMLLRVLGKSDIGDAKTLKKRFAPYVGNHSTEKGNYGKYFTKNVLLATQEPTICQLLKLLQ